MSDILFETERLYMRVPILEDVDQVQIAKELNWDQLQKWMSWATGDQYSIDAMKNYIGRIVPMEIEQGGLPIFSFCKNTNDFVISTGLVKTDQNNVYRTGYWGNVNYLGKGYATESTKGMIQYAFNACNAEKVEIVYYEGNEKSRRVIEKCGFEFVETKPHAHRCFLDGVMMDEHCYVMTKKQWRERY